MKNTLLLIILFLFFGTIASKAQSVPVFTAGTEGHKSYRIPAIIKLPSGDLLAFAEGRVQGAGDFGDINIVLKRSKDNGKTWGKLSTVVNYDTLQAGNPAPVVDLTDKRFPKGRIFLFFNTGNNHEGEVRKGKGLREVWYKTSTDGGFTWSDDVNITTQVHRPNQPQTNPMYNFKEDWRSYANTPGHATQFLAGKYKGRIYVAANHSEGNPRKQSADYFAHGFYTDNHGESFQLSETIMKEGGNEATATPISGNRLMLNARNQKGDVRQRIVAISNNGGQTWDKTYFDANLPDPVCQGSILTIGQQKGKHILAFCNAADTQKRDNLTLRISFDDGQTWPIAKLVDKSSDKQQNDYTAYSDIVAIGKREIGVLYEKSNYTQIVLNTISWK
ncbi:sialidase family protein [Arcicella lustrica]|uniref:exo-alpha-sialidase n=1 Tax=Arcicella lustrica TaxID=2984196 RepID=A0ABU5SK90_9BACT|nr:sialidase family protein [Arcicella sp. DC25W]MEA5427717.1 sialidase family protein [Arcicella sp. DC25W]